LTEFHGSAHEFPEDFRTLADLEEVRGDSQFEDANSGE